MATGATEFIDRTTADVFIPEVWSGLAIVARENKLIFGNLVDRRFESELKVGDVVHVPSVGNLATRTKSINTAITYETVTETNLDITVTTHEYAAIAVESIAELQTNRAQLELYAGKMGYALALSFDDVLAGLVDNFTQVVGTLAVELTLEDILRAIQYLDDADVPSEERVFVMSPAQSIAMLKYDSFIHKDYESMHGPVGGAMEAGYVTSFLGIPILKSVNVEGTNSAGHDNGLFHKSALAAIMQMTPSAHSMYDIDYLADKVAIEHVHGSAEMRDDHGVWMKGL